MDGMRLNIDHAWIPEVLRDLETYAELHDQPKVVSLICAARGAVTQALGAIEMESDGTGKTDEHWFDIALDELARYCHFHGFAETEEHLVTALESWVEAQEATHRKGNVIPYHTTTR